MPEMHILSVETNHIDQYPRGDTLDPLYGRVTLPKPLTDTLSHSMLRVPGAP
jgi:hypothetical protein